MSKIAECPNCGHKTNVIETYHSVLKGHITRRRLCKRCDHRYSTVEIMHTEYQNLTQAVAAYNAAKQSLQELYIILEDIVTEQE